MNDLHIDRVSKVFGDKKVLADVDLSIGDGELLVVIGPSGSGKTTLLRIIAGLTKPDGGRIWIDGLDVTGKPPGKRNVAMVFQDYAVYPHMSVEHNLGFSLKLQGVPRAEIERRVEDLGKRLDIIGEFKKYPSQLSGGELQRVALGRAIIRSPRVFLLDEPLASLDAPLRTRSRDLIRSVQRTQATPMVYVTHDQEEALALGDRVAVLEAGQIRQVGVPTEIYERPTDLFVAKFIGSPQMQLFKGGIALAEGKVRFVSANLHFDLGSRFGEFDGFSVQLGIRAEDVELVCPGSGGTEGEVRLVETLGPDELVHVAFSRCESVMARVAGRGQWRAGDAVEVKLRGKAIHIFDVDSGKRCCGS